MIPPLQELYQYQPHKHISTATLQDQKSSYFSRTPALVAVCSPSQKQELLLNVSWMIKSHENKLLSTRSNSCWLIHLERKYWRCFHFIYCLVFTSSNISEMPLWIVSLEEIFVSFGPYRVAKKIFSLVCQWTRNAVGCASPKPNKFKKAIEVFATLKEWSLPIRNKLQQKQYSHTTILSNYQHLNSIPIVKCFVRTTSLERFLRYFILLSPPGGAAKGPFLYFSGPTLTDSTLNYVLSLSHQGERFEGWPSAFVPQLLRCIVCLLYFGCIANRLICCRLYDMKEKTGVKLKRKNNIEGNRFTDLQNMIFLVSSLVLVAEEQMTVLGRLGVHFCITFWVEVNLRLLARLFCGSCCIHLIWY